MARNQNPFENGILDDEEQAIEEAIERGEYRDVPDTVVSKKLIEEAASRYLQLNTTKPVTLRVRQTDLIKIKAKAKRSNIPYQTLLSALLHDFAEGETELTIRFMSGCGSQQYFRRRPTDGHCSFVSARTERSTCLQFLLSSFTL